MLLPPIRVHCVLLMAALATGCSSSSTNGNAGGAGGAGGGGGTAGTGAGGAAGSVSGPTLYCDGKNCDVKTDKCCFGATDTGLSGAECSPMGTKCPVALNRTLLCDDAEDCQAQANSVCCATMASVCAAGEGSEHCITGAQCAQPASCAGNSVILCNPAATSACPAGFTCHPELGTIHRGVCQPG